jgi:hypothetical protein
MGMSKFGGPASAMPWTPRVTGVGVDDLIARRPIEVDHRQRRPHLRRVVGVVVDALELHEHAPAAGREPERFGQAVGVGELAEVDRRGRPRVEVDDDEVGAIVLAHDGGVIIHQRDVAGIRAAREHDGLAAGQVGRVDDADRVDRRMDDETAPGPTPGAGDRLLQIV